MTLIRAFFTDHFKSVFEGVLANVLGVIATSLILVRIVSEQGEISLSNYVYHIAVVNIVSSVSGSGISNYLIRKWSDDGGRLISQAVTTAIFLSGLCAGCYFIYYNDQSILLPAILALLVLKRALSAIFRVQRDFSTLLQISGVEFVTIAAFFILTLFELQYAWTLILFVAYFLSSLLFVAKLFSIKTINIRPRMETFLSQKEIYLLFLITLLQSLGLYGERFVLRYTGGDAVMTEIFRETYVFRLGLTLFTVLASVFLGYLGKMKVSQIQSFEKTFWQLSFLCSFGCATILVFVRHVINKHLLIFESQLSSTTCFLLTLAFAFFYVARMVRPLITKFGNSWELVVIEMIFTSSFLGALLWLNNAVSVGLYACALVLANALSLGYSLCVFRRVRLHSFSV